MNSVILRCGLMLYEVSKVISFLLFFVSNLNIDVFIQTNCLKGLGYSCLLPFLSVPVLIFFANNFSFFF